MIIDELLEFSDAQALSGAGNTASTNVIDLGLDRDIGPGRPMYVVITVDVAADVVDTDETYTIKLQTDTVENFASATDLVTIAPAGAALTAGSQHVFNVPNTNERYLRLYYTLGGTTPSVTLSAHLTDQEPRALRAYANSSNIGTV